MCNDQLSSQELMNELDKTKIKLDKEIHKNKKLKEKLELSESQNQILLDRSIDNGKYRTMVETFPNPIVLLDLNAKIKYANLVRYVQNVSEVIGKSAYEFTKPEYKQSMKEAFDSAVKNRKTTEMEGQNIWDSYFRIQFIPIIRDGKINELLCTSFNIDKRKQVEIELKESEEKFRSLSENAILGIGVFQDRVIKYVNQAYSTIVGYSVEELMGIKADEIKNLIHPEDRTIVIERARKKQSGVTDVSPNYQYRIVTKNNEIKWINVFSKAVQYGGRNASLVSMIDITKDKEIEQRQSKFLDEIKRSNQKLKESEDELKLSNQELNEFASIVSHDLKAPLRGIGGLAGLIERKGKDDFNEETLGLLERLTNQIKRMDNLIEDILEHSKIGRTSYEKKVIDSNQIISDVVKKLNPPQNISIEFKGTLPQINYNETQLIQIFTNLIQNGITHLGKPKGEIIISCVERANNWEYCVRDNGIGIEQRHHEKIFKIFQTLQPKKSIESTGMGLAIVKKIVETNNGKIGVESKPGEGSSFYFTILKN